MKTYTAYEKAYLISTGQIPLTGVPKDNRVRHLTIIFVIACWFIGSAIGVAS